MVYQQITHKKNDKLLTQDLQSEIIQFCTLQRKLIDALIVSNLDMVL